MTELIQTIYIFLASSGRLAWEVIKFVVRPPAFQESDEKDKFSRITAVWLVSSKLQSITAALRPLREK